MSDTKDKLVVFISAGHYLNDPGTINTRIGLEEHEEAMKVTKLLDPLYVRPLDFDIVHVPSVALPLKIAWINQQATLLKKDGKNNMVIIEIHYNSSPAPGPHGIETLYYPGSKRGQYLAVGLLHGLVNHLPFKNRGVQERNNLGLLSKTIIPACIVEVLFLNNDEEASYLKHHCRAHSVVANAIIDGIQKYEIICANGGY